MRKEVYLVVFTFIFTNFLEKFSPGCYSCGLKFAVAIRQLIIFWCAFLCSRYWFEWEVFWRSCSPSFILFPWEVSRNEIRWRSFI